MASMQSFHDGSSAHPQPQITQRQGGRIRVFSRSANAWISGTVEKRVGASHIRVEYKVADYWYGKTLHENSRFLRDFSDHIITSAPYTSPPSPGPYGSEAGHALGDDVQRTPRTSPPSPLPGGGELEQASNIDTSTPTFAPSSVIGRTVGQASGIDGQSTLLFPLPLAGDRTAEPTSDIDGQTMAPFAPPSPGGSAAEQASSFERETPTRLPSSLVPSSVVGRTAEQGSGRTAEQTSGIDRQTLLPFASPFISGRSAEQASGTDEQTTLPFAPPFVGGRAAEQASRIDRQTTNFFVPSSACGNTAEQARGVDMQLLPFPPPSACHSLRSADIAPNPGCAAGSEVGGDRQTQSGLLLVMRHSVRLDNDETATWEDKQRRPYDPPIIDFDLPAAEARELMRRGLGSFDLIICSPYRRCLQTASVVAATLGTTRRLRIDKQFGEKTSAVRDLQRSVWGCTRQADGVVEYLSEEAQLGILSHDSSGFLTAIEAQDGEMPAPNESAPEATERFMNACRRLREGRCQAGQKVLVLAHGDTVDGAVRAFTDEVAYSTEECCWVAFSFDDRGTATRIASNRMMTLPASVLDE